MLLPLRDVNPSARYPFVVVSLIVINVIVYFFFQPYNPQAFVLTWGFRPFELFYHSLPPGENISPIVNIFTAMFLHGGIVHIFSNMLFLWIFGDNVEDFYGHGNFILFYFTCGVGAALMQAFLDPTSTVPMIGASGAISGVLGAYLFLYPHARIRTLIFLFIFADIIDIPASAYILIWFLSQLMGLFSPSSGGIAFGAHVGGFITGYLITRWVFNRKYKRFITRRL